MRYLLIFAIFLLPTMVSARLQLQPKIDSLIASLKVTKQDTTRVRLLNEAAYYVGIVNASEGIKYGKEALQLAQKLQSREGMARAYLNIGASHKSLGEYTNAQVCDSLGLHLYRLLGDAVGIASAMANYGNLYIALGKYDLATQHLTNALETFKSTDYKEKEAACLNSIGLAYFYMNRYTESITQYNASISLYNNLNNERGMAKGMLGIGQVQEAKENYDAAKDAYFKALKLNEKASEVSVVAYNYCCLAHIYYIQKNYPHAIEYYSNGLNLAQTIGYNAGIVNALDGIAFSYFGLKDYPTGLGFSQRALIAAQNMKDKGLLAKVATHMASGYLGIATTGQAIKPDSVVKGSAAANIAAANELLAYMADADSNNLMEVLTVKIALDTAQGKYQAAFDHYEEYMRLKAIYNERHLNGNNALKLQESNKLLAQKQERLTMVEERVKEQAMWFMVTLGAFALILLLVVLYIVSLKKRSKKEVVAPTPAPIVMPLQESKPIVPRDTQPIVPTQSLTMVLRQLKMLAQGNVATILPQQLVLLEMVVQQYQEHMAKEEGSLSPFLQKLLLHIVQQHIQEGQNINIQASAGNVTCTLERLVTMSLLLQLLVSVSFVHAFKEGASGALQISVQERGDLCLISYSDGQLKSFQMNEATASIIKTIQLLCKDAGGSFLYNQQEDCFAVSFKAQ